MHRSLISGVFEEVVNSDDCPVVGYELLGRGGCHPKLPERPGLLFRIAESADLAIELSESFREHGVALAVKHGLGDRLPIFANTHPNENDVGCRPRILSINLGRKLRCLQAGTSMFAGRHTYYLDAKLVRPNYRYSPSERARQALIPSDDKFSSPQLLDVVQLRFCQSPLSFSFPPVIADSH
jgi:hypothetical protein